jgi:hypothetical protein
MTDKRIFMKTFTFPFFLISLFCLLSCDKKDNDKVYNDDVENYIALLKSGQYDSSDLPSFTYKDIPALLQYRNEIQIIKQFPVNPLSSSFIPECKLGVYVLWTIESIRAPLIKNESFIFRFPSLNPILVLKYPLQTSSNSYIVSHEIAAKAYYDWWENNKTRNFDEFKNIDPLKDTDFEWQ